MLAKFLLRTVFVLLTLLTASEQVLAQFPFERRETSTGQLGLSLSNYGTIGKPDVRNNPQSGNSMRYPLNSGNTAMEHLFEAGLWIGAYTDGVLRFSSAAVTDPSGYQTGRAGYEFTASSTMRVEGEAITGIGVSDEDIIAEFTDRNIVIPGTNIPISGHTDPLGADVKMESFNWGFPFTENFSILKYTITNNSNLYDNVVEATWDSLFVGMYADLVVRNVTAENVETGGQFFNKGGLGFLDSLYTTYAFDAGSSDDPSLNTYGSISIIGSIYRDEFFHPFNDELEASGYNTPMVDPSYWLFFSGTGQFNQPTNDEERYQRMSTPFDFEAVQGGQTAREALREDGQNASGNYLSMISIGPYPSVEPGESIEVYFVYAAALKPDQFQSQVFKEVDTEESREILENTINSAIRVFQGNDTNNNNRLDPGEDTNNTGTLDRFVFPTPPDAPRVKLVLESGSVTLYWDKTAELSRDPVTNELDFEGYKIYRSELGEDALPSLRVIREFDKTGNEVGFNTGFSEVELMDPVTFADEDDSVEYWYRYKVDGLLSGWQYQFSVTSFDGGSETFALDPLETSPNINSVRVFPGTPVNDDFDSGSESNKVGVYPNPYRVNAAWDGSGENNRKIIFYNLPERAEIRIYTLAGDIVSEFNFESQSYSGDTEWFDTQSGTPRTFSGGEYAWDILSQSNQTLRTGLYLFSVKDLSNGATQTGKFVIIK